MRFVPLSIFLYRQHFERTFDKNHETRNTVSASLKVVHRDIAARNILIGDSKKPTQRFSAKIGDFGLAEVLGASGIFVSDKKVCSYTCWCFEGKG